MKAKLKRWGGDSVGVTFTDLNTRPCTLKDFDDKEDSLYFPIFETHRPQVEDYVDKLQCISQDFDLYGDYSSESASHLIL